MHTFFPPSHSVARPFFIFISYYSTFCHLRRSRGVPVSSASRRFFCGKVDKQPLTPTQAEIRVYYLGVPSAMVNQQTIAVDTNGPSVVCHISSFGYRLTAKKNSKSLQFKSLFMSWH